jgi:hypothetical protein
MELTGFTIQVPIVIKMGYDTSVVLFKWHWYGNRGSPYRLVNSL